MKPRHTPSLPFDDTVGDTHLPAQSREEHDNLQRIFRGKEEGMIAVETVFPLETWLRGAISN